MQSVQKVYENQMRTEFVSKEDPEQVKAFEYYCTLGRKRSYKKVAEKFEVSKKTIAEWAQKFNWQRRVQVRNTEINRELEKEGKKRNMDYKEELIQDVDNVSEIIRTSILTTLELIKNEQIEFETIKSTNQFLQLAGALDRLTKLKLMLLEEIEGKEKTITLLLPDDLDDL